MKNAKHIAALPGLTTFSNSTSTTNHVIQVDDDYYIVEIGCLESIENCPTPRSVRRLTPLPIDAKPALIDAINALKVMTKVIEQNPT